MDSSHPLTMGDICGRVIDMKHGDTVTDGHKTMTLLTLSHPTHIGGMYYGVQDHATGRRFFIKSYMLTKVEV